MSAYALITGGAGFLGSHIARQLVSDGHVERVVLLDHFGRYADSTSKTFTDYRAARLSDIAKNVIVERGEARFSSVLFRLLQKYRPIYIFHLAALPLAKIENLNTEEAREGSVDATSRMFEIINELGNISNYKPTRFVYASSSMVYGDFRNEAISESHPTHPKELYGTMKLAGEVVTSGLGRHFDVPWTIVRPSAVYGPTDMNRRVSQIFIEKAFRGECLTIHGRNEALDFTFVEDAARGFVLAATHEAAIGETFNITFGQACTLLEFAQVLKEHFPDLTYKIVERDSFRPRRGTLSIKKARKVIGYEPHYSLREGIAKYVEFIRKHPF